MRFDVRFYEPRQTCTRIQATREMIEHWIALACRAFASSKSPNTLVKRIIVTHPDGTTSGLVLQPDGRWGKLLN